jgi:hypothetical protein
MTTPPYTAPPRPATWAVPLRERAVAASVCVWIAATGAVAAAIVTFVLGPTPRIPVDRTEALLRTGAGLLAVLGLAAAAIAVVLWLRRARANAEALSPAPHRLGPGWAVAGWIVPVASYFVPFMVVSDVVRASAPAGRAPTVLRVWWASWIGACLVQLLAQFAPVVSWANLVLVPLYTAAAAAFTVLARQLARWQDERIAA